MVQVSCEENIQEKKVEKINKQTSINGQYAFIKNKIKMRLKKTNPGLQSWSQK